MSNHIINPIGPRKNTKRNTKQADFSLFDASIAAHILQISTIKNQIIANINSPPNILRYIIVIIKYKKMFN
jgi:hypothetical protein